MIAATACSIETQGSFTGTICSMFESSLGDLQEQTVGRAQTHLDEMGARKPTGHSSNQRLNAAFDTALACRSLRARP